MKVLFDQNVPRPLARQLPAHDVKRAAELGWAELKNGNLLSVAENAGFEVILSADKKMRYEQNMAGRTIYLVYMSDNHWTIVSNYIDAISFAIDGAKPGEIQSVYCGTFRSRKSHKID